MAFVHGKGGVFKVDDSAGVLQTLTTYVDQWSISNSVDMAETTTMGSEAKTYLSGQSDATISVSGFFDSTASTGPHVVLFGLIGKETSSTFELGPEGGTSGKVKVTGECFLTGYEITVAGGDASKFTADFQATGAITNTTFS